MIKCCFDLLLQKYLFWLLLLPVYSSSQIHLEDLKSQDVDILTIFRLLNNWEISAVLFQMSLN